jgi:hypothetical protein
MLRPWLLLRAYSTANALELLSFMFAPTTWDVKSFWTAPPSPIVLAAYAFTFSL